MTNSAALLSRIKDRSLAIDPHAPVNGPIEIRAIQICPLLPIPILPWITLASTPIDASNPK